MYGEESFYINDFGDGQSHPQFNILKKHIERAVQDMFLESLRSGTNELLYVFNDEKQIEEFVKRILDYWERIENYEACKEVLELTKDFKERWKNREEIEDSSALLRIRELFKSHQ